MSGAHITVTCQRCQRVERVDIFDHYSEHFDIDMGHMEDACNDCIKQIEGGRP
ncbi:hypothetical protein GS500_04615 [Rhodococcus hoagii]|nr:hypothetical protein [Prescottella equi]